MATWLVVSFSLCYCLAMGLLSSRSTTELIVRRIGSKS